MSLDLRTINIFTALACALLGLVMLGSRRSLPKTIRGVRAWGSAPFLALGSALVYGLDKQLPAWTVIALANGLAIAAVTLMLLGTKGLYGEPLHWRRWAAWGAACLGTMLVFLLVVPSYPVRLAVFCLCLSAMMLAHARVLLAHTLGFVQCVMLAALIGHTAVLLMRAVATFFIDAPTGQRFEAAPFLHTIYIGSFSVTSLLLIMSALLLLQERARLYIEHLANHDELTGVWSRRALLALAEAEHQRHKRYGTPYALLMIDLDHFKRINDTYGHQAGDAILAQAARCIEQSLRTTDKLGRYGGEEFLAVLPQADSASAATVAERIRAAVEQGSAAADKPGCTVSIGIAWVERGDTRLDDVIARADAALYGAKAGGRNRACVQQAPEPGKQATG